MFIFALGLFILNYLTSISRAYYIDDSNTTAIQYIPPRRWVHDSTDSNVDFSKLYYSSYTYGTCHSRDGCKISIPFAGSGITIYHLQWDHLNASISLDGTFSTTYIHDASCIRQTPFGCYNTTLYDTQSLAYGDHVLEISLQDYMGDYSNFNFDYVFVYETGVTRPSATATATVTASETTTTITTTIARATAIATATSQATASESPSKRTPTAAIVGGLIGGIAVVAVTIPLVLCVFRRQSRTNDDGLAFIGENPVVLPAGTSIPVASSHFPQNIPPIIPTAFRNEPPVPPSSNAMYLGTSTASTFGQETVGVPVGSTIISPTQASETEDRTQNATSEQGRFTVEQISSMTQHLLRQNVPAQIVATVVESMIRVNTEELSTSQVGVAERLTAGGVHNPRLDAPPPGYDSKTVDAGYRSYHKK